MISDDHSRSLAPARAGAAPAFAHPYYAVTDETGRFRIAGVPVGRHQLVVHQPAGGLRRQVSVEVAEQGVARVTVHFTASDLRLASAVPVN